MRVNTLQAKDRTPAGPSMDQLKRTVVEQQREPSLSSLLTDPEKVSYSTGLFQVTREGQAFVLPKSVDA